MSYDYNAVSDASYGIAALSGIMLIFVLIIMIIAFAAGILQIVAMWKLFNKAGKPGWASIVPVYNIIVLFEIIGYKWYYIFLFLLGCVPIVGQLALVLFSIHYNVKLSKAFGKDIGYGIGLAFLPVVFMLIFAFSKNINYVGPTVNGLNLRLLLNGGYMKDKRMLLRVGSIIETIYTIVMMVYYILKGKLTDEVIANLFILIIGFIVGVLLFKISLKSIDEIKKNKVKILFLSIWLFLDPVIPGILGFIFLSSISDKKREDLPKVNDKEVNLKEFIKQVLVIALFIIIMFVLPNFKFFSKVPTYMVYIFLLLLVFLANYKYIKEDFNLFMQNKRVYLKFIVRRYLYMLGIMVVVAIPVVLLNKGATSSNQQILNGMFKKMPIGMLLLSTIYAPFTEENIFRLSLSKLFKNKTLFIIVSGLLFGTLHMIDKFTSFYDLLYIIQYSALGICLAKAYSDSKNIFVSIGMHFIQNFLAAILVLLLY